MYVTGNIEDGYFHSIVQCGLIFSGNSSHSANIFKVQKNRIRIIRGCRSRETCRDLFKNVNILPLESLYVPSLLVFLANNNNRFLLNSDVHHINKGQKCNFHQPSSNFSPHHKRVYPVGIKWFNSLPQSIKNISDNPKQFKSALKDYLYVHCFYCTWIYSCAQTMRNYAKWVALYQLLLYVCM